MIWIFFVISVALLQIWYCPEALQSLDSLSILIIVYGVALLLTLSLRTPPPLGALVRPPLLASRARLVHAFWTLIENSLTSFMCLLCGFRTCAHSGSPAHVLEGRDAEGRP